jgi:acetyl-CoA carboxylase biotin carboxyl carrier protein
MMDLDWIRRLLELVEDSDIDTLELSRFGTRVRVSKSPPGGGGAVRVVSSGAQTAEPAPAAPRPAPTGASAPEAAESPEGDEAGEMDDLHAITSPMVGTFYRSPAPDAPPYVEVGDRVRKGQTLCILEAMKLMNELEAEVAGVVREIAVENADPVEYGQVLFRIETDGAG